MKIAPGATQAAQKAMTPEEAKDLHAKKEAARAFEAIFVRKMLSSLEKSASGAASNANGGGGIYASMMVGSLADAVTQQGGIGLSDMIMRALGPTPHKSPHSVSPQSPPAGTANVADRPESKK